MANKWLAHVKKTMKSHKGMKFGQVLKMAKKTYKGGGGGPVPHSDFGGSADLSYSGANNASTSLRVDDAAVVGGRRRRSRRSRKTRRGGQY
jgi:hypothetical protein